jgi:hypothetical protein
MFGLLHTRSWYSKQKEEEEDDDDDDDEYDMAV